VEVIAIINGGADFTPMMHGTKSSGALQGRPRTPNTPNNDAPSFDMAISNLCERQIEVAQARPLLIEEYSGRACVVGRDVRRNAQSPERFVNIKQLTYT
jgi:hypothetical protein